MGNTSVTTEEKCLTLAEHVRNENAHLRHTLNDCKKKPVYIITLLLERYALPYDLLVVITLYYYELLRLPVPMVNESLFRLNSDRFALQRWDYAIRPPNQVGTYSVAPSHTTFIYIHITLIEESNDLFEGTMIAVMKHRSSYDCIGYDRFTLLPHIEIPIVLTLFLSDIRVSNASLRIYANDKALKYVGSQPVGYAPPLSLARNTYMLKFIWELLNGNKKYITIGAFVSAERKAELYHEVCTFGRSIILSKEEGYTIVYRPLEESHLLVRFIAFLYDMYETKEEHERLSTKLDPFHSPSFTKID